MKWNWITILLTILPTEENVAEGKVYDVGCVDNRPSSPSPPSSMPTHDHLGLNYQIQTSLNCVQMCLFSANTRMHVSCVFLRHGLILKLAMTVYTSTALAHRTEATERVLRSQVNTAGVVCVFTSTRDIVWEKAFGLRGPYLFFWIRNFWKKSR